MSDEEGYTDEEDYLSRESSMESQCSYLDREESFGDIREAPKFTCMSKSDLIKLQMEAIKSVKEVVCSHGRMCAQCGPIIRQLLRVFLWNPSLLITKVFDDPESVYKRAKIEPPSDDVRAISSVKGLCPVCFCNDEETEPLCKIPVCDHALCEDCWQVYLGTQIKDKTKHIFCPGTVEVDGKPTRCPSELDDVTIISLGKLQEHPDLLSVFEDVLVVSFVSENPLVSWCPGTDCVHAIRLSEDALKTQAVECAAGHRFCFSCKKDPHAPASCEMLEEWSKLVGGGLDDDFVKATTMGCPHCKAPVWRSSGCDHMHCAPPGGCGFHFCYVCGGKFGSGPMGGSDGYGNHRCNSYKPSEKDTENKLLQFNFYHGRLLNHLTARKLESRLLEDVEAVQNVMYENLLLIHGDTLLRTAVEQLLAARRVLEYSYIFANFRAQFNPEVNQLLFEDQQFQLENVVRMMASQLQSADHGLDTAESNVYKDDRTSRKPVDAVVVAPTAKTSKSYWRTPQELSENIGRIRDLSEGIRKWMRNLIDSPDNWV